LPGHPKMTSTGPTFRLGDLASFSRVPGGYPATWQVSLEQIPHREIWQCAR